MTLPVTVPNTFANATTSIPLANLDANFTTIYAAVNGIGNGSETLANVQVSGGTLSNVTLDNVTVDVETLSNVTLVDVTVTSGNATFTTANATTIDTTNIEVTNIKAKDGTASVSIADSTGIPTISKATVISTTDNTNAALRITQLGTGNALLVEDSANPDSTPFVVDANGAVIIGYTALSASVKYDGTALTPELQKQGATQGASAIGVFGWSSASSSSGSLSFNKSKSGTIGTRGVVASGDVLGSVAFAGDDGTNFITSAAIRTEVDGTPGTNDMPGRLVFSTTADGASTPTERMRINSVGEVGIGGTPTAGRTFEALKNITGSTTGIGIRSAGVIQSDVTTEGRYFTSGSATQATSFTLASLSHYYATQGTFGAGSTVTNQSGFRAESTLTGATNNYGFFSNIASGTGRWNFYANGTADNYFAGQSQFANGSASTPSISNINDTNTGIFFPAADTIAFAEGGAEAMRIDSSGNVGIGTTTPGANNKLQVTSAGATRLYVENSANSVGVRLQTLTNAGLLQTDTNHPLTFATNNGAEIARFTETGGYLRMASGTGGIQFGGDTAAANALDDYEEGTWTPTLTASSSAPSSVTYSIQTGSYTKIGNMVTVFVRLQTTAKSGGSGTALIGGLPFTTNGTYRNGAAVAYVSNVTLSAGFTQCGLSPDEGVTTMRFVESGSGVGANVIAIGNVGAGLDAVFSFTYTV